MVLATSYELQVVLATSYKLRDTRFFNQTERRCKYGKQMWWRNQEERFGHEEEVTCTNSLIKA